MTLKDRYSEITEAINDIADEVNTVLGDCIKQKYFDSTVLLYSFIENLLKWLVFTKILWDLDRVPNEGEIDAIRNYCKNLSFYNAQQLSLSIGILDWALYKRIDSLRKERNDMIHQFWLYSHRGDNRVIRKKLEKVARVVGSLVGIFNDLGEEIGVDEYYEFML
jgi:hypothetical protein